MEGTGIFFQIGLLIIVATFLSYIVRALKQPLIPSYIVAGLLLGPVFGLIGDPTSIIELAEIGVAFLLFVVGLELDFKKLKNIGKVALFGATAQIFLLFFLGLAIGKSLGFSGMESFYLGLIVSFSSTMVVVKLLSDKSELDTLHGKIIIGFLLVEDFFAILAISSLSTLSDFNFLFLIIAVLKTVLLLIVSYFLNKYVFQRLFAYAAKTQELLFLISLSSCFFFAFLFMYFGEMLMFLFGLLPITFTPQYIDMITPGFSIAMGAFIAGIGLASMPYAYEVIGKVRSLRDFFATLFFVSLGIQLSNASLSAMIKPIIAFVILVIIVKPIITFLITIAFGYAKRTCFETSTSLSQSSEFSLIIVYAGVAMGHLSTDFISLVVILSLLTISTTSYSFKYNKFVYSKLYKLLALVETAVQKNNNLHYLPKKKIRNEVLIIGFDRIGFAIYKTLIKLKKNFMVVDFNPDVIHNLIKKKVHCIYGDIADEEIVERIGLEKAKMVISTIPDIENTKYLVVKTRKTNKNCTLIVTSYSVEEALELYDMGVDYVILPHLLGGNHASLILEEFNKDFSSLMKKKVEHIEELNEHLDMGHTKNGRSKKKGKKS